MDQCSRKASRLFLPTIFAACLAACHSPVVREFRPDYERALRTSVKIDGYAPFSILEPTGQKRVQVSLNTLAQVFAPLTSATVLLGFSNGIPPASAHRAAALAHLVETGRQGCTLGEEAVSPTGREYEFRYSCPE